MKFLVDECIGTTATNWLKHNNYDAISIYGELRGADDNTVLNKALVENRILITSDKDFGEMIFKNKKQHCGIILMRLVDERPSNKIQVLKSLLKNYHQDLFGNFVVTTEQTVRIIKPSLS